MVQGISRTQHLSVVSNNGFLKHKIRFLESKIKLLEDKLYKKRHGSIKYRDLKKY